MPNNVKHFAINADDVPRARAFYEKAFGWQFTPWGPPGFYLIRTGTKDDPGVHGALQGRREIVAGKPMFGLVLSAPSASTRSMKPSPRSRKTAERSSCLNSKFQLWAP